MTEQGTGKYFLETERLGFRLWTENDMELAWSLWGAPEVTEFIGGPFTRERVRERLLTEVENGKKHGVQYWPLFLLETGEFAGACGLRPWKPEKRFYEFGFYFRKEFWGRGLATEAGKGVIGRAFGELDAARLGAGHHPENPVSGKALKKLGFKYLKDCHYPPTGRMHPFYLLKPKEKV